MIKKRKKRYSIKILLAVILCALIVFAYKRTLMVPLNKSGDNKIEIKTEKDSLVLFSLGDTGSGSTSQFEVGAAMEARCKELGGIDGILLLGDNIYSSGVATARDPLWKSRFEQAYDHPCLANVPMFPILGNHDYKGKPGAQIDYSLVNSQWNLPYRFYTASFDKLLKVVAIDSGFPDFCFSAKHCSMDFLLKETKESDATWTIVTSHHPLSSASALGYSHSGGVFGFLLRPFICDKADAWLSGHAHHLEHRKLDSCATDMFTSGGGGADLYKVKTEDASKFVKSTYGFLELNIQQEQIDFSFRDSLGDILYKSTKKK